MKKFTIVLIAVLIATTAYAGTYSGGSGTFGDPYQIATTEDLIELSNTSGDWDKYFIQTANISFDEDETQVDWNNSGSAGPAEGFSPIGTNPELGGTAFTGSYDGGGHTIDNLFIDRSSTSDIGLFGYSNGVTITDIGVTNVDITGYWSVGSLAGANYSSTVSNSYCTGSISGDEIIGGLVGYNNSSIVSNSYSTGSVTGNDDVGGLVGYHNSSSTVSNSYSTGNVNGNYMVGGLVGRNFSSTVSNSYSTGSVSGNTTFGGLVGDNMGGATVTDSFWDITAESTDNGIGTGLTSTQMQVQSNFTNWDFTNTWAMSSDITFNEYPTLQWTGAYAEEPSQSGSNYQIAGLPNLVWIAESSFRWDNDYEQTADINAWTTPSWDDGKGWTPIGNTTRFSGTYDGQGHTIENLYINRSSDLIGLFGYTGNGDIIVIENICCSNVDITGNDRVGGLVGAIDDATVSNCYTTGSVTSTGTSNNGDGGLAGANYSGSQISKCYSTCSVSGNDNNIGGLVGYNSGGHVYDCYSRGSVSGDQYVGGLVGGNTNYSTINNCYSTGSVSGNWVGGLVGRKSSGAVYYSYWDTETSGQSILSGGGTGKTTDEMHTRSTYAGWDFESIWSMSPGYNDGYPNHDNEASYTDITWQGDVDDQWGTAGNWDLGVVPNSTHNVIITTDGQAPVIPQDYGQEDYGAECHNLTVQNGATLSIPHPNTPPEVGALITYGTITNNGTIEIGFNTPQEDWHLVSSPVTSITAEIFEGDYLQIWDEPTEEWVEIIDETTPLTPAKGYSLWPTFAKNSTQYTFTGTPNTGDQAIDLSNSGTGDNEGMTLAGNPYPCPINWDLLQPTYGTAYIWVPANDDYVEWNESSGGEQNIATLQGFFVYTDGTNTSLNLKNRHRTFGNTTHYKSADAGNESSNELVLGASNGSYADKYTLRFDEQAAAGFELTKDSWKLLSDGEGVCQIWSESPDGKLAMDTRPYEPVIQLGFQNNQPGVYSIGIEEIADIPEVYLEDYKTGEFHNLQTGEYEFAWNPELDNENRFKLHLNAVGIEETPGSESDILIYAANGIIYIKPATEHAARATITDIMGRILHQQEISGQETIIPVNYKTGVYIVTVESGKEVKTEKVFIK